MSEKKLIEILEKEIKKLSDNDLEKLDILVWAERHSREQKPNEKKDRIVGSWKDTDNYMNNSTPVYEDEDGNYYYIDIDGNRVDVDYPYEEEEE